MSESLVVASAKTQIPMYRIELPEPKAGAKAFLIEKQGIYILETGPGTLRSLACTHIGAGTLRVFDGIPNDTGHFPDEGVDPFSKDYMTANGRKLFVMSPKIIGFFGLDAGFSNGLTIVADGGPETMPVFLSVMWVKYKGTGGGAKKKVEMLTD